VCRALKLLCVASDSARLVEVKRAAVSADWELAPGATDVAGALEQLESERPHVVVAIGVSPDAVRTLRERAPYVRIVSDVEAPEANVVIHDATQIRGAVKGMSIPGGPVLR
jgi:hypothetical protein